MIHHPDASSSSSSPPTNPSNSDDFQHLTEARDILLLALKNRQGSATNLTSMSDILASPTTSPPPFNVDNLSRPENVVESYVEFAEFVRDKGLGKMEEIIRNR